MKKISYFIYIVVLQFIFHQLQLEKKIPRSILHLKKNSEIYFTNQRRIERSFGAIEAARSFHPKSGPAASSILHKKRLSLSLSHTHFSIPLLHLALDVGENSGSVTGEE